MSKFEVTLEYESLLKHFKIYSSNHDDKDCDIMYIIPNDIEIMNYKDNYVLYGDYQGLWHDLIFILTDKVLSNYSKVNSKTDGIDVYDFMLFEFDTEEEALYFKLKYC